MGGGKNKKKKGSGGGGGGGGAQKSGGGGKKQKAAAESVPPVEDEFDPMNPPEADYEDDAGVDYDDGDVVEGVTGKMNELAVSGSDDLSAQASASSVDTSGINGNIYKIGILVHHGSYVYVRVCGYYDV